MPRAGSAGRLLGLDRVVRAALLSVLLGAPIQAAFASERELDTDPAPRSAEEIETAIGRVFPVEEERSPLFHWLPDRVKDLPPFFSDSHLDVRYRTYYLRKDRVDNDTSEAWAMGGSVAFRSGWLADLFQTELEFFTSQPIVAPDSKDGTQLLKPGQEGYSVLGIANGKLRYGGLVLTGFRQYLDLPYANRRDNRMTPNTFESVTLKKPEGALRFSTGYSWKVKLRNSENFRSFPKAFGVDADRGLAHLSVVWQPGPWMQLGVSGGAIPDVLGTAYGELNLSHAFAEGVVGRLDVQGTFRNDIGDDLFGDRLDDSWNVGFRFAGSYAGFVARVGGTFTGNNSIASFFGTNPSYADLMQRAFTAEDEKALLASLSYDFGGVGLDGLTAIVNFVAAFDGRRRGVRQDAQELDVTVDYRIPGGWLGSLWLRVRGSWLHSQRSEQDGHDVRVILRYDLPVL